IPFQNRKRKQEFLLRKERKEDLLSTLDNKLYVFCQLSYYSDRDTSIIYASEAWWKNPPIFWEVMVRCFALHDVQSQSQPSAHQRRKELINTHLMKKLTMDRTQIVVIDHKHNLKRWKTRSIPIKQFVEAINEGEKIYNQALDEKLLEFLSRVGHEKIEEDHFFETTLQNTIAGYIEFQRQSLQQLRPAGSIDENKLQLLEAMTVNSGAHRQLLNNGVHHQMLSNGVHRQMLSNGPTQQWEQPPNAQQWNTPPTSQQWGTPSNSQQWRPRPNISQWSTPPNASQWNTPPNALQWGLSQNTSGWGISSNFQQDGPSRTNPTTVQYGFSVGSEEESVMNTQENNAAVRTSQNYNADTSYTPRQ
ncbi:LOW QUALITY PROTEIN: hypothetical protein HID58_037833, partial [Brassica napus]